MIDSGIELIATIGQLLAGFVDPVASLEWFEQAGLDVVLQDDDDGDLFKMAVFGFGFGLILIYKGVDAYRKSRLIKDTSTERVRSMAVGRTELEGVANEIDTPLKQPFTDGECLYASWKIEEYTKDSDDDWSWDTIDSGAYTEPFILEDETGRVVVDAETDATWELSGELTRRWTISGGSSPNGVISEFCSQQGVSSVDSNKRRYTQTVLPPATSVYVLGESTPYDVGEIESITDADQRLKIQRDAGSDRFIISDMAEEELASYYGKRAPLYAIGGLVLSAVCLYIILGMLL